jgi:hypothetical protein
MTATALWQASTSATHRGDDMHVGYERSSQRFKLSEPRHPGCRNSQGPATQDESLDDGVTQGVLGVSTGVTKHLFYGGRIVAKKKAAKKAAKKTAKKKAKK